MGLQAVSYGRRISVKIYLTGDLWIKDAPETEKADFTYEKLIELEAKMKNP